MNRTESHHTAIGIMRRKAKRWRTTLVWGLSMVIGFGLGDAVLAQESVVGQQAQVVEGLVPGGTHSLPLELSNSQVTEPETRLVLSLGDRQVRLYKGETEMARYPIAVGKPGWETPVGEFAIYQKVLNPTWRHPWNGSLVEPGAANPLGAHWVGFLDRGDVAFGLHGTIDESLIGQAVSHGCVRMKNADIAALFDQVEVGTTVVIQP